MSFDVTQGKLYLSVDLPTIPAAVTLEGNTEYHSDCLSVPKPTIVGSLTPAAGLSPTNPLPLLTNCSSAAFWFASIFKSPAVKNTTAW